MITTTTTTAAMLGAVVVAVAGAALASAVLPPAHAAAGEPGTLAFSLGGLGGASVYEFSDVVDVDVGPNGEIAMLDKRQRDGLRVFHPNGTIHFGANIVTPIYDHPYDGDTVHVAPNGSVLVRFYSQVMSFHPNGTHAATFETRVPDGAGGTSPLRGALRLLPGGNMAVSQNASQIAVFHPNGTYAFSFGQHGRYYGELRDTTYAAVGPGGKLFVDSGNNRIEVFHPNGTYDSTVRMDNGRLVDVGPSGELAFQSGWGHCNIYHPNGTHAFDVDYRSSSGGACTFGPTGMVVTSHVNRDHGDYYAISILHGIGSDVRPAPPSFAAPPGPPAYVPPAYLPPGPPAYVPPAARPLSLAGGSFAFEFGSYGEGPGEFLAPRNIAVGPGGVIAVSDAENNRIQLFHPNGTFAFELGSRGSGPGELAGPYGLTFAPNGLLVVADVGNHRVQVFRIQ